MVRSISDSLLDAKEQEQARGTLSFEELLDMKASTHEARIPDWLRTGTGNESKEDSLDSITLDDYINQENKIFIINYGYKKFFNWINLI